MEKIEKKFLHNLGKLTSGVYIPHKRTILLGFDKENYLLAINISDFSA